jgi:predicted transcriptional regulator
MKRVRDYMHKDITSVNENSKLRRVIQTMKLHRMSAVPIVDQQGHYKGCITASEILNASVPEYMKSITNTSFMANLDQITNHLRSILDENAGNFIDKKHVSVSPDDTMSYAADLLYRYKRTILPVVDGKVQVGWISKIDILYVSLDDEDE